MVGPDGMLPEDADPIAAFAQQLGIHPDEDAEFGWLAEVGLQSPLPPRWTGHADETTGFAYYVDHDRQVSSWENPLVPYLRRIVEIGRGYLQKRSEEFFDEQKGILWAQHKHDLDCWHGPFSDAEGRSYYVNSTAGISSWQDPRVDAQYIFELESGLLTTLAEVLPPPEPDTPGWAEKQADGLQWRTGSGAEVLTLEEDVEEDATRPISSGGAQPRGLQRRLTESMAMWSRNNNRDEHKSALEKMEDTAKWLRSAQQDEEEVQRLQFARRIQERKQRRQRTQKASGSKERVAMEDLTSLSRQPLGPMPGQDRCSPASGIMAGRRLPTPLQSADLQQAPHGLGTPAGGATGGDTPPGSPAGPTPAGTPAGPTPAGTPLGSPTNAFPPSCSPAALKVGSTLPLPPGPPPELGASSPTVQGGSLVLELSAQGAPAPAEEGIRPLVEPSTQAAAAPTVQRLSAVGDQVAPLPPLQGLTPHPETDLSAQAAPSATVLDLRAQGAPATTVQGRVPVTEVPLGKVLDGSSAKPGRKEPRRLFASLVAAASEQ